MLNKNHGSISTTVIHYHITHSQHPATTESFITIYFFPNQYQYNNLYESIDYILYSDVWRSSDRCGHPSMGGSDDLFLC